MTVELYTDRCIVAILSLERQVICWPDKEERQEVKRRIKAESGFPSCLGFVDGTLFVLKYKPLLDGEDYYSRKHRLYATTTRGSGTSTRVGQAVHMTLAYSTTVLWQ